MEGKEVPLCLDGWTNVSNDSIIASFIHNGKVYIAETTDASAVKHFRDNLAEIALQHMRAAKEKFGVKVFAIVTREHGQNEEDSARETWYP